MGDGGKKGILKQAPLLDIEPYWAKHWIGMPEYIHEDMTPFRSVIVHFDSPSSADKFADAIGQKITGDTKSLWYPEQDIWSNANIRYGDEETC